jgi:hypothetical protein
LDDTTRSDEIYGKLERSLEEFHEELGRIDLHDEGRKAIEQQMRAFLSTAKLATSWQPAVAGVGGDV